jgi:two-component system, chemotaxis family, protein-glutamate methylesterase/glutaminase
VLIVQHMPKLFTGALAERLNRLCRMPVREAAAGDSFGAGGIWLAPGDSHMEIGANSTIRLHQGPMLNSCKPSVDYLFRSAAEVYGGSTLALIMTGMGADGVDGADAIHAAGGTVLAQDQASSAVWGMPGRVARAGLADAVLPLGSLANELVQRVQGTRSARSREYFRPDIANIHEVNHAVL